jgi:hypothetical protein
MRACRSCSWCAVSLCYCIVELRGPSLMPPETALCHRSAPYRPLAACTFRADATFKGPYCCATPSGLGRQNISEWPCRHDQHWCAAEPCAACTAAAASCAMLVKRGLHAHLSVLPSPGAALHLWFPGGVMGTHDEDTRKYFANTRVNCELFPREGAHAQDSIVGRNTTDRIFTHHQKTVRSYAGAEAVSACRQMPGGSHQGVPR